MSKRRVAITGIGILSPLGNDLASSWDGIVNGRSGIGPITHFDASAFATRISGEVKGFDAAQWIPAKDIKKMDPFVHYGVAAALMSIADAGLDIAADPEHIGVAIGAGTDVAIETADVVLMRSDPLDVAIALKIGKGTLRKMRQNLGWAIGYNAAALPIAAGVFYPAFGIMLSPEIAALSMSGSSVIVAVNALLLKRLRLPAQAPAATTMQKEPEHA